MIRKVYPAHGWLPPGAHFQLEWDDQGKDFATDWDGVVQAPGDGEVIAIHSDAPFPSGFGPEYPVVRIDTGPWANHEYYIGHNTSLVHAGDRFSFGQPLARANQGKDWAGTVGGWVELGEAWNGLPGPKSPSHWYDKLIATPLVLKIPNPPLHYGMKGTPVLRLTSHLQDCGYLSRPYWHFNSEVHGAVVAFKKHHHMKMPDIKSKNDRGIVDEHTAEVIAHTAQWCRKHHKKETQVSVDL